jgi:hypothetical protein
VARNSLGEHWTDDGGWDQESTYVQENAVVDDIAHVLGVLIVASIG